MNKRQLEVQKAALTDEKKIIRLLQQVYKKASEDCQQKINDLAARQDLQNIQAIVYQQQYQKALKQQIDSILNDLQASSFQNISDYLTQCYENGFFGTLYDLQGQGIPLIIPIDQSQVVKAVQTDAQLSKPMYDRLGEDVSYLKRSIKAELSRGIANGSTWFEMAEKISKGMNSPLKTSMYNAMRIARTEGHRIQNQAQWETVNKAKDKGADVVKQWDATLDDRTRASHKLLDGQIRELDEAFEVNGHKAMFPGSFGVASEDIHCRCCMLQRAKWALDDAELQTLKERAAYYGLDKTKDFNDFKQKYLKLPANADTIETGDSVHSPAKSDDEHYNKCLKVFQDAGVEYLPVEAHKTQLTDEEIIKAISGADKTSGSCASVGFAYIGQKQGWNVTDFRGGDSMEAFRNWDNLRELPKIEGLKVLRAKGACSLTVGNRLLKQVKKGKEYYLCAGQHASIVRRNSDDVLQYLELQSDNGGWKDFDKNPRYTLSWRFGCTNTSNRWHEILDFLIDIDESKLDTDEIRTIMGYINTKTDEQMKGNGGGIK